MSEALASGPVTFYSFRVAKETHYVISCGLWPFDNSDPKNPVPPPAYKLYTWETLPMMLKMRLVMIDTSEEMNANLEKAGRSPIEYPNYGRYRVEIPEHLKRVGYRLNKSFYDDMTYYLPRDLAIQVEAIRRGNVEESYDRLRTYMFYFTKKELEELSKL